MVWGFFSGLFCLCGLFFERGGFLWVLLVGSVSVFGFGLGGSSLCGFGLVGGCVVFLWGFGGWCPGGSVVAGVFFLLAWLFWGSTLIFFSFLFFGFLSFWFWFWFGVGLVGVLVFWLLVFGFFFGERGSK